MASAHVLGLLKYEMWIFVGGLAVVVSYRLLTGSLNIDGLLNEKSGERSLSPVRLQLLLFTIGGAIYYVSLCYTAKNFVPVPNLLVEILGGSNGLYLVRKYLSQLHHDD